jgi:hypothetical protein
MKKSIIAIAASTAAVALVPLTVLGVGSATATVRHQQAPPGAITLQSWLYAVPSSNTLSATVWECFKITGAINDQGGGPTWTNNDSYAAPNTLTSGGVAAASQECSDKVPSGGFVLVPPPGSADGLTTVYANHMIAGRKGDIYITFSGTANFTSSVVQVKLASGSSVDVQPLTSGPQSTWVITGGTGAYTGLRGAGTWVTNAQNTFPWINHLDQGQVWWSNPA